MSTESHRLVVGGVPVEVCRRDIKHLHIGVYPPRGKVRVAVPLRLTDDAVRLALVSRLAWIRRQQAAFEAQERQSEREMVSGESHYFQGRRYRLRVLESDGPASVRLVGNSPTDFFETSLVQPPNWTASRQSGFNFAGLQPPTWLQLNGGYPESRYQPLSTSPTGNYSNVFRSQWAEIAIFLSRQPDPVAALRSALAAETERVAAIRALASGQPAIEAKAIKEGWDATRTELEVLRASRPQAPAVCVRDQGMTAAVLEAACVLAGRHTDAGKVCDHQALEAADRRFRGRIGLQRLLMEAAWANGCTVRSFKDDPRAVLKAAWGGDTVEAGGLSSIDLPGILSNVANKFLLAGFASAEAVWRNICRISPVTDFKQVTRYRLVGNMTYERVAPGGEIKHGSLGEEKFTNQAATYGKMVSISREDLINDDLGVLTGVPQELGRGAGQSLNDLFWTVFLDHAAFFTAGNRNLVTGVDTVLSIDGLTKAEVLFN